MQESKFLREFCSSSGIQKEKIRRLSIRTLGVSSAVISNPFSSFYFFLFPKVFTMTLGIHRATCYRATGMSSCTHV